MTQQEALALLACMHEQPDGVPDIDRDAVIRFFVTMRGAVDTVEPQVLAPSDADASMWSLLDVQPGLWARKHRVP